MAQSKKNKYKTELLEVIKKHKIAFFDHCFAFTSFSRPTAYIHKLNDLDEIKNAINENRVKAKNYMLNKWIAGDNATLQLAAFRLCADSEEHKKLNQQYIDHTNDGQKFEASGMSTEELLKRAQAIKSIKESENDN